MSAREDRRDVLAFDLGAEVGVWSQPTHEDLVLVDSDLLNPSEALARMRAGLDLLDEETRRRADQALAELFVERLRSDVLQPTREAYEREGLLEKSPRPPREDDYQRHDPTLQRRRRWRG